MKREQMELCSRKWTSVSGQKLSCPLHKTKLILKIESNVVLFSIILILTCPIVSTHLVSIVRSPFVDYILNPCGVMEPIGSQLENGIKISDVVIERELLWASQLAFILVQELEKSLGKSECNGLSLDSLTPIPDMSNMQMGTALETMSKVLVNYLAHVYFIAYEIEKLSLHCHNGTLAKEFYRLAGKLQYLLCNIIQALPKSHRRLPQILYDIKNINIYFHMSCSATEMQECLVLTGTIELLETITARLKAEETLFPKNHLTVQNQN